MGWLRRLFGGGDDLAPAAPVVLDVEARKEQLQDLERTLDQLVEVMKANEQRRDNPAWRERIAEYRRLSGESYKLRAGTFTREQLVDLAFEIRPVFGGELPHDLREIEPLQKELVEKAEKLQVVLPSERPEAAS
ncbi:MAG TPA: hypothetical protein VIL34_05075 [Actinopolymorphaceae bacterium]